MAISDKRKESMYNYAKKNIAEVVVRRDGS